MELQVDYDPEANALYVRLSDRPYAFGEDLDHERRIDYAEDGTPIGVEFTCARGGVDLTGIPHANDIANALRSYDLPVYA